MARLYVAFLCYIIDATASIVQHCPYGPDTRHIPPQPRTHARRHQPAPALSPYDASEDAALLEGSPEGADWAEEEYGGSSDGGREEAQEWVSRRTGTSRSCAHTTVRQRIDEVEFHPSCTADGVAVAEGLAGAPWADERPAPMLARSARGLVWDTRRRTRLSDVDDVRRRPALRASPNWPRLRALLTHGCTTGPARAHREARAAGRDGDDGEAGRSDSGRTPQRPPPRRTGVYTLRGHKWFTSAPMCDVFLVLGAGSGRSVLLSWWRAYCRRQPQHVPYPALKDKLGNRFQRVLGTRVRRTVAWLVGPEGRGVKTIIEMVNCTAWTA